MNTFGHHVADFDLVELTEPVDHALAGARSGVLELRPDDTAMDPPLDPAARIIFALLAKLRVIKARAQVSGMEAFWKPQIS